jgi:hypothetical protein
MSTKYTSEEVIPDRQNGEIIPHSIGNLTARFIAPLEELAIP